MSRKRWIVIGSVIAAVAAIAVAAVLVLGGGGGDSSSSVPEGGPPAGFGETSQQLQDCLAEQGVDPGSGGPPQGAPDADMQQAFEACQQYLPQPPDGAGDGFPAPSDGGQGFAPPGS